ncbi:MAG: hypothetical protein HZA84_01225 [Thaumarchaeota archaeon]|nr:hypothetical protein [Nitrososphaerota archaeon]
MSTIQNIPTTYDSKATSELRTRILQNEALSKDLAEAMAKVFNKHGFVPTRDQLVALEPVVTRLVPKNRVRPLTKGSSNMVVDDLTVGIHLVESRQPILNYAITSSAWNG